MLSLSLSACSESSTTDSNPSNNSSIAESTTQTTTDTTTKESETTTTTTTTTIETTTEETEKIKPIELSKPFDVGNTMTVTINSMEWCEELMPSNTSSAYSYYKDIAGEKYIVIHGTLKNNASQDLDPRYSGRAEIIINDKYKHTASMVTEDTDSTNFYGSVKPLQTKPLFVFCSVSDELYNQCKTITLNLELLSDESGVGYYYNNYTIHESFTITLNK